MPDTIAPRSFNYTSLDTETAEFIQQQTTEIKGLFRQSIENILRIGQGLLQVKERLPHGQWLDWLEAEFGWTDRTALNYMHAAEQFKLETVSDLNMAARALYLLASPSTPEEAREEALERAQAGERITVTAARNLRDKYVPPKPAPNAAPPALGSPPVLEPQPSASAPAAQEQPSHSSIQPLPQPAIQSLPQVEHSAITPTPAKRRRAKEDKLFVVAPKQVRPQEWWKLGNDNYLYCGAPASVEFQKLLPEDIALSLVSPPNREAWPQSAPENAISIASIFTPYQEDQDLRLFRQIMDGYIQLYTDGGDTVVLGFLPDPAILPLLEQLGCRFFCADPDPAHCDSAITVWTTTGGSAEKMKSRQTGKKRLSSPALAK